MTDPTVYEVLGGEATLGKLVEAFYDKVVQDETLSPLFAGSEISEVKRKQQLFLTQFLGGPQTYSELYGHPMLRYRHLPFPITKRHAEAWLACMSAAMDDIGCSGTARDFVFARLTQVAHHMVNTEDGPE